MNLIPRDLNGFYIKWKETSFGLLDVDHAGSSFNDPVALIRPKLLELQIQSAERQKRAVFCKILLDNFF